MSLVLGFSAFAQQFAPKAQQRVAKKELQAVKVDSKKTIVGKEVVASAAAYAPTVATSAVVNRYDDMLLGETMTTYYDLQSNGWCSNRMIQLPNGDVAVTATWSHQNNQSASDRGTGYNFYSSEADEWGDMPEARVEPARCGWPTIAQWGETGEVLISHAPNHCYIREVAGEGEWEDMGLMPDSPAGYPYTDDYAWPRVATSGDNHNIIHVIGDIQHSFGPSSDPDSIWHHQVYLRSENGADWDIMYSPLDQDGEVYKHYTADNYCIAANGHTVAIIYSDDLQGHVVMYKSTNDGQTWERTVIWENPYYGCDWENDECSLYTDTMYGPSNTSMVIDDNGVVHVAINVYEYIHDELGSTYTVYSGRGVDGIYYWNDTREAPIQSKDGNPHHALRLWWDDEENPGYMKMDADSTIWIGYIPMYEGISWENDNFYHENEYFYKMRGASAMPALSVDPWGNVACAYTAPCTASTNAAGKYYRRIYVSYYNADEGYWHQVEDCLTDDADNPEFDGSENVYTIGVNNTYIPGEFWFGCQTDDKVGFYWGSNATQTTGSENTIYTFKVVPEEGMVNVPENTEAKDVVYNIYPNPVVGNTMTVQSSQAADATITIVNLVGQTVKQFNQHLTMGNNAISVDLKNGIYFCTISANGFDKTVKFVVK